MRPKLYVGIHDNGQMMWFETTIDAVLWAQRYSQWTVYNRYGRII